jgi:hypothetical protein
VKRLSLALFPWQEFDRLLKNAGICFDELGMNGFCSIISIPFPFVLSPSKDSERVFQQLVEV